MIRFEKRSLLFEENAYAAVRFLEKSAEAGELDQIENMQDIVAVLDEALSKWEQAQSKLEAYGIQ